MAADLLATDEDFRKWILSFTTAGEYNASSIIEKGQLYREFKSEQQQQRRDVARNEARTGILPPSTGKEPKKESAPKASPSSEEGAEEGQIIQQQHRYLNSKLLQMT